MAWTRAPGSGARATCSLCVDAEQTFGSLAGARDDHGGLVAPSGEEIVADPAAQTADAEQRDVLEARIGRLHRAWQEQLAAAGGVRARLLEAARRAGATIRAAGRTSPTADQNWFQDRFVAEHAAALRSVAKALRVVGVALVAVAAVLAVLGFGGAIMAAGLVVWGAGDALP